MEKVLNQILETLKELKDGQDGIHKEINGVNQEVAGLKQEVSGIKQEVSEIKQEVSEINRKVSVIFDQTANLTEFRTDTTDRLQRVELKITGIEQEMATIEKVTAKNCFDITHLKAIK